MHGLGRLLLGVPPVVHGAPSAALTAGGSPEVATSAVHGTHHTRSVHKLLKGRTIIGYISNLPGVAREGLTKNSIIRV